MTPAATARYSRAPASNIVRSPAASLRNGSSIRSQACRVLENRRLEKSPRDVRARRRALGGHGMASRSDVWRGGGGEPAAAPPLFPDRGPANIFPGAKAGGGPPCPGPHPPAPP